MKYTTVEGHEIKVGDCYETREGTKVYIFCEKEGWLFGVFVGEPDDHIWHINGKWLSQVESPYDLMRPWMEKEECPGCKVDLQLERLKNKKLTEMLEDVAKNPKPPVCEKPDADGWIKHDGKGRPSELDAARVDIKFSNNDIIKGIRANSLAWAFGWRGAKSVYTAITAYRVCKEQPEQKKEVKYEDKPFGKDVKIGKPTRHGLLDRIASSKEGCDNCIAPAGVLISIDLLTGCCLLCGRNVKNPKQPEQKKVYKQNLAEYAHSKYDNLDLLTPLELIDIISDYMESYNV